MFQKDQVNVFSYPFQSLWGNVEVISEDDEAKWDVEQ